MWSAGRDWQQRTGLCKHEACLGILCAQASCGSLAHGPSAPAAFSCSLPHVQCYLPHTCMPLPCHAVGTQQAAG